jgi:hypothetical protein
LQLLTEQGIQRNFRVEEMRLEKNENNCINLCALNTKTCPFNSLLGIVEISELSHHTTSVTPSFQEPISGR